MIYWSMLPSKKFQSVFWNTRLYIQKPALLATVMPRRVRNFAFLKFPFPQCLLYPRQFCSLILTGSDSHQVFRFVIKSTSYRLSNLSTAKNLSLVPAVTTVTIKDALPQPLSWYDEHVDVKPYVHYPVQLK